MWFCSGLYWASSPVVIEGGGGESTAGADWVDEFEIVDP